MRHQHTAFELASIAREVRPKLIRLGAKQSEADAILEKITDDLPTFHHCIARCEAAGDPAGLTAHLRGMLEGHRAEMQRVRAR